MRQSASNCIQMLANAIKRPQMIYLYRKKKVYK
nr:MAG TPA: hypothetical protein [Caudoviricetes sp.]